MTAASKSRFTNVVILNETTTIVNLLTLSSISYLSALEQSLQNTRDVLAL